MVPIDLILITSFDPWAIHTVIILGNTLTHFILAHIPLDFSSIHRKLSCFVHEDWVISYLKCLTERVALCSTHTEMDDPGS